MMFTRRIKRTCISLFGLLLVPGKILNRSLSSFFRLLGSWWKDRQLKHLFWGTPAVFVGVGSLFMLLTAGAQSNSVKASSYLEAAQKSMDTQSFAASKLYFERALELEPGNHEAMFKLAQVANASGDEQRVGPIMEKLAPVDRPVYAEAHLWKAKWHFTHPQTNMQHHRDAENQLLLVLQLEPDNIQANLLLGEMYYTQGAMVEPPIKELVERCIKHLSEATKNPKVRKEYTLLLARSYARLNDPIKGARYGEIALQHFAEASRENPDDPDALYNWADAAMFLERYSEATALLRKTLQVRDQEKTRIGLAKVCVAWSDTLDRSTVAGRKQCFQLLTAALSAFPNEMSIFDRMISLLLKDDDLTKTAQQELLDNITNGHAVAMSHLILGVLAYENKDQKEAEFHLQKAYEQLPQAPVIINNFAWYMAHGTNPNFEQSLKMMNELILRYPEQQVFRDTRGFILLRLNRPEEAITDLELALQTHAGNPDTHAALAEAYQLIGMSELAIRHQQAAQKAAADIPVKPVGEFEELQKSPEKSE